MKLNLDQVVPLTVGSIMILSASCSFSPPPNTGAFDRSVTETNESKAVTNRAPTGQLQTRNLPDLSRSRVFTNYGESYRYYTNAAQDRLVESHTIKSPPIPPGHGPVPVRVVAPAVSNMFTAKVLPKPMPVPNTNFLRNMILSRVTTTDDEGETFTAELVLEGDITIRAGAKMSVVMILIHYPDYIIEVKRSLDDEWTPLASGIGQDTNSVLTILDLHQGTKPIGFYRQKAAP